MASATTAPHARIEPATEIVIAEDVPPLENGDRLSRQEFERRYVAMPHVKKAELIDGVVYMPSPVGHKKHGKPHLHVVTWLGHYEAATPGVEGGDNSSLRLDLDNMPQPDAFLRILTEAGGRTRVDQDDYLEGAPEFIFEVASSSASYDLHQKLDVYRRHGCPEYAVWRVRDRAVSWFVLRDGRYEALEPGPDGLFRSLVLPGLWLDPAALIAGDLARVLAALDQGLASPEHAAFVAALRARQAQA